MIVVGIAGRKGHGKDEFAKVLVHRWDFKVLRFADPLKDMLRTLYKHAGLTSEATERRIEGDLKGEEDWALQGATPRWAMQSLGTEWRNGLNPGKSHVLWSGILLNKLATERPDARIVVPDLRFPHELDALNRMNAITFRVRRPAKLLDDVDQNHDSERLIDRLDVDYELTNTGTLEEYQRAVTDKMETILHG